MQLELESDRAEVNDLKHSVEREKETLQSHVAALETQMSELKAELQHERLTCRQMKNEIEKIQVIPVTCLFTLFPWTADVVVFITVNFHTFPWSFDVVVFNILSLHTFPWSFDVVVSIL